MNKVALAKSLKRIGVGKVQKSEKQKVVAKLNLLKELDKLGIAVEAGMVKKSDIRKALKKSVAENKSVSAYELTNWAYEHPDYFQGMGVSGTQFDTIYVGNGDTAESAAEDALDMATESGVSFSDEMLKDIEADMKKLGGTDESEGEMQYFVGLRLKFA